MHTPADLASLDARRLLRRAAAVLLGAALIFSLCCAALAVLAPTPLWGVGIAALLTVAAASGLALRMGADRPLDHIALPIGVSLLTAGVLAWTFIPGFLVIAVEDLLLAMVIVSGGGSRRTTRAVALLAGGLALAMLGAGESPWRIGGPMLALDVLRALIGVTELGVIWLFLDQFNAIQSHALAERGRRQAEAEAARAEAEVRSADQRRRLELVQALEVPLIPVGDAALVAPLVGSFDERRVSATQRRLLEAVAERRAHTVILDVTGLSAIDTDVARGLVATVNAVRLLGARTLVSGISPAFAQILIRLGLPLDELEVVSDLGQTFAVAAR